MKELFKVLEFKDDRSKILGRYAIPMEFEKGKIEFGGCAIPTLMTIETTIKELEAIYPTLDFREVRLKTVKLSEIQTNRA